MLATAINEGQLGGSVDAPVMLAAAPSRALLLATMHRRSIELPCYDSVIDNEGNCVAVEKLWGELHSAGGAAEVRVGRGRGYVALGLSWEGLPGGKPAWRQACSHLTCGFLLNHRLLATTRWRPCWIRRAMGWTWVC